MSEAPLYDRGIAGTVKAWRSSLRYGGKENLFFILVMIKDEPTNLCGN